VGREEKIEMGGKKKAFLNMRFSGYFSLFFKN